MIEELKAGGIEVHVDHTLMLFNESNLNEYLQKEGPQCDYLLSKLAEIEADFEVKYSLRFVEYKDEGGTEKYVEARCKANPELAIYTMVIKKLKNHLKAWDINHQNAQAFGHNLRKELEKLGNEIKFRSDPAVDARVMDVFKATTGDHSILDE
jgi:hypothetical protein